MRFIIIVWIQVVAVWGMVWYGVWYVAVWAPRSMGPGRTRFPRSRRRGVCAQRPACQASCFKVSTDAVKSVLCANHQHTAKNSTSLPPACLHILARCSQARSSDVALSSRKARGLPALKNWGSIDILHCESLEIVQRRLLATYKHCPVRNPKTRLPLAKIDMPLSRAATR